MGAVQVVVRGPRLLKVNWERTVDMGHDDDVVVDDNVHSWLAVDLIEEDFSRLV